MDLKAHILSRPKRVVELHVPEWDVSVRVQELSSADRDRFEMEIGDPDKSVEGLKNIRARVVAVSIVDEEGKRVFDDGDVAALGALGSGGVSRVFDKATELNAIGKKKADAVEDAAKN